MRAMASHQHHAVLADPTRRAILDRIETHGPQDVPSLASALGMHRNSVRDQLRRLEAAGMVRSGPDAPRGRGRPRLRYAAVPGVRDDPHRVLASALVDEIAARPGAVELGVAAGDRWGRAAAREAGAGEDPQADPMGRVIGMLEAAGFDPGPSAEGDGAVDLHACPFLPIEPSRLAIVCGVHLGFIRGALEEGDAWAGTVAIQPFARPGVCVARISPERS